MKVIFVENGYILGKFAKGA